MRRVWKPVCDIDNCYASSDGLIKRGTFIYVPSICKGDYLRVRMLIGGKRRKFMVHVLVARAFLGPKLKHMQVNHKDLNKGNNNITNLEYLTPKQNVRHAITNGVKWGTKPNGFGKSRSGEMGTTTKLTKNQVKQIIQTYSNGLCQRLIAEQYGVCRSTISHIVCGRSWRDV